VQRIVALVAGVVALFMAAYTCSRLGAKPDTPARPSTPKTTRVAILNLRFITKNYKKVKGLTLTEDADDLKAMREKEGELFRQIANTTDAEDRAQLVKDLHDLRNEVKEMSDSVAAMVRAYKEIRDAATRYAKANHIDLVLQFAGPVKREEINSPAFLQRYFKAGCCPLHWRGSVDISADVLKTLNDAFDRSKRAPSSQ
jgi:hypothetical protein